MQISLHYPGTSMSMQVLLYLGGREVRVRKGSVIADAEAGMR